MSIETKLPQLVLFEDDHLLIVNKPPGWNTHSPAPYAGEGIYEWLKNREPRWAKLAIIHRLDKETSGVMLFTKTPEANRSLTQQFTEGKVRKEYILETIHPPPKSKFTAHSTLVRIGDRYASIPVADEVTSRPLPRPPGEGRGEGPAHPAGVEAITEFELIETHDSPPSYVIAARPHTGRTHQIRVHASENGFPILGDTLYGGEPFTRLCLHAQSIQFSHPATGETTQFTARRFFNGPLWFWRRHDLFLETETNSHRCLHGASDGFPDWHVDQFGSFLLSQSPEPITPERTQYLQAWLPGKAIYHKITTAHIREKSPEDASPKLIQTSTTQSSALSPQSFPSTIRENNVQFEINFAEGYSPGIFLDQRDNRRRLLTNHIAPDFPVFAPPFAPPSRSSRPFAVNPSSPLPEVLNTFAYTCAFSVCAALAGARVTSLDLSRKYLDWGRRNFQLNNLDPAAHDFIYGDVFDWMKRLAKKNRLFDLILLDPPTFSKSKQGGLFRAEHDYPRLIADALKLLRPNGILFASSNAARWSPEDFVNTIHAAVGKIGRRIIREHYVPQPPDFPISKTEPAYLKTLWLSTE